jgi:hypothetical protein
MMVLFFIWSAICQSLRSIDAGDALGGDEIDLLEHFGD